MGKMKKRKQQTKHNSSTGRGGAASQGHVQINVRSFLAPANVPATVVQTLGTLTGDNTGLLWISTFAALAQIFRYFRLNSLKVNMWPAISSGYAARTYFPSTALYYAPFGSDAPTSIQELEASPRILGPLSNPMVFPIEATSTDPVVVLKECVISLTLKNRDLVVSAETDRPGYLLTDSVGPQTSYGTIYYVKRAAGSGTSTNYDAQMDINASLCDLVDPTAIVALMEHRTNPLVSIDPNFLRQSLSQYSSNTMVKSPALVPTSSGSPPNKDELLAKLAALLG